MMSATVGNREIEALHLVCSRFRVIVTTEIPNLEEADMSS